MHLLFYYVNIEISEAVTFCITELIKMKTYSNQLLHSFVKYISKVDYDYMCQYFKGYETCSEIIWFLSLHKSFMKAQIIYVMPKYGCIPMIEISERMMMNKFHKFNLFCALKLTDEY